MNENLSVTKYSNGDEIFQAKTMDDLNMAEKEHMGAWCYIDDEGDVTITENKYGKLYNWFAVSDPRGLCPKGWHVPNILEYENLVEHLGGVQQALKLLKSNKSWVDNGTNETGFSAVPTSNEGYASYWTATDAPPFGLGNSRNKDNAYSFRIEENYIYKDGTYSKKWPMAVRCVKGY
jgi:uncharacterized protein (TIGR02145 family)